MRDSRAHELREERDAVMASVRQRDSALQASIAVCVGSNLLDEASDPKKFGRDCHADLKLCWCDDKA